MAALERLGPYVIESSLGSGGMGSVFLGVDEQSGERAAVKVLAPALAADPNFRERFGTEVETLKKLRHPNIVQLLGYGEQDGQLFYAMEMVEGRTLQQELQAARRFQWREVARIGVQICLALKHAHDRGIIHRDLKPANLLYTSDEQVKLADFGIAKLYGMSQLTVAGGVIGTADYMSPEQGEGKGVTTRSDLYSLGSVLFTLLAGRPPFASRTAAEVIHKLHYEEAPKVRRLAPDTPEEFEQIVAQLLEKKPADRIATALAVGNRLKAMDYALSLETRVTADSDEFDLAQDNKQRSNDADADSSDTRAIAPADRLTSLSKEDLQQHRNSTVAMPNPLSPPSKSDTATDTHSTHFTTFDEAARQRATSLTAPEERTPVWLTFGPLLVAVALIIAAIWYFSRPASAESLRHKIMTVADSGETSELVKVEPAIDEYLERFPDTPQYDEVRELRDELNRYRLQKRLERQARNQNKLEDHGPVERAYINATRLATTDKLAAVEQLQAILDVYADADISDQDKRCLNLVRNQLREQTTQSRDLYDDEIKAIEERLDAADAMAAERPDRAQEIRRGIVTIYSTKSWAQPSVARAQAAIAADDSQ